MNRIKLILIAFVLIASISIASATDVSGWIKTDTTWNLTGSPYNVTDDVKVLHATLTIDPGVTVNFEERTLLRISAGGKLLAEGTSEDKITFTGAEKTKGYWEGIVFMPASDDTSAIDNAIIEYGGYAHSSNNWRFANLITYNAAPSINGSMIRNSGGGGILCIGPHSTPTITCNWITNNENGVYTVANAEPAIGNNNICGNSEYGVLNRLTTRTVDATNNWWGNATGPTHSGNPGGTGDAVSDKVDYSGWTGSPVPCAPIPELSSVILVAAGIMMLAGCARIGRRD